MSLSFANILFVLIIFQLIFLSLFLFTQKKGKGVSNVLLGLFFLSIGFNLLDVFLLATGAYASNPNFTGWGSCIPLLFGPFIYFYTRSVVQKDFKMAFRNFWHFLPFIIIFCFTEFYFISQPHNVQEKILADLLNHHLPKSVAIISTLIFIQFLLYILASLREVSLYKKNASQYFSNSKRTDVSWLYSTIIFLLLITIISTLNGLLAQTSLAKYFLTGFNLVVLAMFVFIILVLLKALRNPYFFSFSEENEGSSEMLSLSKTTSSGTEINEKEKIAEMISQYMQNYKPYIESDLTLNQLASQLSLKPRVLSQVINEILGQNFYDFINHYRIEEASRLLTNPKDKKITVLEVLYEVGFNSKSSFNTLFKKYTGLTPSEFRKKQSG